VSHQPERKEKNCLNCGTTVLGRYCHECGQENIETKESFFSLLKHFVYDILHFDNKFFDTLKYILFRPGFVAKEYVEGKRARYLHPIRMYLFTSAIFFVVFFSLGNLKTGFLDLNATTDTLSRKDRVEILEDLKKELPRKPGDSELLRSIRRLQDTTRPVTPVDINTVEGKPLFGFGDSTYISVAKYDSAQRKIPATSRDGWIKQKIIRKSIEINIRYHGDASETLKAFAELFFHKLSYLLFILLPFFALILRLLYIRRRNFYYSDHAVFTLYHYIFSFILLLFIFVFVALQNWWHLTVFSYFIRGLLIAWFLYLFLALRQFYRQGWGKTFSKFLLLNLLGIIVLLLLFIVYFFFTLFQL